MRYENNFCTIEYSDSDSEYITEMIKSLEENYEKILDFFNISKLNNKVQIKLWDSLDDFGKIYKKIYKRDPHDWTCGFSFNDPNLSRLDVLCLRERRKTKGHEDSTEKNMINALIHEFIHTCHMQFCNYNYPLKYVSEGIATYLSNQYNNEENTFNCSLGDLIADKIVRYDNYFCMMSYIINSHEHDYVLKLAKDRSFSIQQLPILYNEMITINKQI